MVQRDGWWWWRIGIVVVGLLSLGGLASGARADIRQPGAHPSYGLELDAHLVLQWHEEGYDEAIGPGLRAYFPVLPQGPIETINNSLALGLGLDLTFSSANCGALDCDNWQAWVPFVASWSFFFSQQFSVFPELGLALQFIEYDSDIETVCRNGVCFGPDSDTFDVELVFWLGARYMFNDRIGVTLRLGTPSLLLGATFLL